MNSSRPIWKGSISFGLVMIPVILFPSDAHSELHFHLLDKRNKSRIRYERINEKTGKVVPWNEIAKAYEFEKGNYVVIDEDELEKTAYENYNTIEIESFVDRDAIEPLYFEKAYYLSPSKQGEKGYALLEKTLEKTKKVGIAKVVIRSRQHLAAVIPYQNILVLNLLRFADEIRSHKDFQIPESHSKSNKISNKEISMAERLVESMSQKWKPTEYHNENRELLHKWIEKKIKSGKSVAEPETKEKPKVKPAKIIDFMSLLKKSVEEKEKPLVKTKAAGKRVYLRKNVIRTTSKGIGKGKRIGKGDDGHKGHTLNQGRNKKKRSKK